MPELGSSYISVSQRWYLSFFFAKIHRLAVGISAEDFVSLSAK